MWRLVKINSFWFRDWPSLSSSNFNLQFAKDLQSGFNVRFNFLVSGPRQALSPPSSIFILQCNCSHVLIDPLCSTKTLKRAIFCWVASHILRCWVGSWLPVLHECKIFLYFSREVATKFLIVWVDDFSHPCLADINWVVDEEKKHTTVKIWCKFNTKITLLFSFIALLTKKLFNSALLYEKAVRLSWRPHSADAKRRLGILVSITENNFYMY